MPAGASELMAESDWVGVRRTGAPFSACVARPSYGVDFPGVRCCHSIPVGSRLPPAKSSPWGCSARFLFGGPLQACRRERLATRSPGGSTPSGGSHTLVDAHISGIVLESLEGPLLGRCLASCAITDSFANRVVKPRSQCQTAAFLSQTLSSHCSGSLNVWRVTKWVTLGASMSSRR